MTWVHLPRSFLCLLVVGVLAWTAVPTDALPAQDDKQWQYYFGTIPVLEGVLVVQNGEKKILWNVNATSDDDVMFQTQVTDEEAAEFRAERHMNNPDGFCAGTVVSGAAGDDLDWPASLLVDAASEEQVPYPCSLVYRSASGVPVTTPTYAIEEWVSEPLPRRVVINANGAWSKGFAVDLYLKENAGVDPPISPCEMRMEWGENPPQRFHEDTIVTSSHDVSTAMWAEPSLDLEIWAGDRLVGGASHGQMWYSDWGRTPGVAGYGTCRYTVDPEAILLAKGTVIKLRVRHVLEQYHYAYGLSGTHRSSLSIWEYKPEDIVHLRPELLVGADYSDPYANETAPAPADPCVGAGETKPAASSSTLPLLAGLPFTGRRRGPRLTLLATLLLGVGFSGCLSGGGGTGRSTDTPTDSGKSVVELIDDCEGILTEEGKGAIIGQVHDDLHQPIAGVHVSLAGQPDFAETDRNGRFQFRDVPAGTYKLRFDSADFKTYDTPVEVQVRKVSKPDIELALKIPRPPGMRPHNHDYWNGRTEVDFEDVVLQPRCGTTPGSACSAPAMTYRLPKALTATKASIVYPGTDLIEVTLLWDEGKLKADRLGLLSNAGEFAPRGPGQKFQLVLPPGSGDQGHRTYSSWSFQILRPLTEELTRQEKQDTSLPGYDWGTITVKTTILRGGIMPLGDPHPDMFEGKDMVDLTPNNDGNVVRIQFEDTVQQPGPFGEVVTAPPCQPDAPPDIPCSHVTRNTIEPRAMPSEARRLDVFVVQNKATSFTYELWYKSAEVAPWEADATTLHNFRKATPQSGGTWEGTRFKLPVTEETADYYYRTYSGGSVYSEWVFAIVVSDETGAWQATTLDPLGEGEGLTYTFTFTAFREP